MPVLVGRNRVYIDQVRQSRHRLREIGAQVRIAERREDHRRGFTRYARDSQHNACDDAVDRGRQHHLHGRFPFRCAQRQGTFTQVARHELEHLLRRS